MAEIPDRLKQFIDTAQARAAEPVQPTNEGADIEATIGAARARLGDLDLAGARSVLAEKIAEEEAARQQRLIPLLEEQVEIDKLSYDYNSAKTTLQKLLYLDPERIWSWIELGDILVTTAALEQAANAFRHSLAIAERLATADPGNAGWQRDLSVSHNKIGDVQRAQGNLAAALTSSRPRGRSESVWRRPTPAMPGGSATSH